MKKKRVGEANRKQQFGKGKKQNSSNFFRFLIIDWKHFFILIFIEVFSLYLHSFVSYFLGREEPVFFAIAIAIPVYLVICGIYTLIKHGGKLLK